MEGPLLSQLLSVSSTPSGQRSVVTLVPDGAGKSVALAMLTVGLLEAMVSRLVYSKLMLHIIPTVNPCARGEAR